MKTSARISRKDYGWLTGEDLKRRWSVNDIELTDIVTSHGLSRYIEVSNRLITAEEFHRNHTDPPALSFYKQYNFEPGWWILKLTDIEKLEKELQDLRTDNQLTDPKPAESQVYEREALVAKDRRELGQLRNEKAKWDESIRATVHAVLFCTTQEKPVTRKKLWGELEEKGCGSIADSTFQKIWKAIPDQYRHKGGRPRTP